METFSDSIEHIFSGIPFRILIGLLFAFFCGCSTHLIWNRLPSKVLRVNTDKLTHSRLTFCNLYRDSTKEFVFYSLLFTGTCIFTHSDLTKLPFIWLISWFLTTLSIIDLHHYLLPDILTLPFLWLGLLFNAYSHTVRPSDAIAGAAMGYTSIWLLFWIVKLRMHKHGIGLGDAKLLAALGAWTGKDNLAWICLWASLGGIIWWALRLIYSNDKNHPLPFGPCLAVPGWVVIADILRS